MAAAGPKRSCPGWYTPRLRRGYGDRPCGERCAHHLTGSASGIHGHGRGACRATTSTTDFKGEIECRRLLERCGPTARGEAALTGSASGVQGHGRGSGSGDEHNWFQDAKNVAIKILDKEKVLRHKMIAQIKREISTMKLIRHPDVIRMYKVMASKTKIYIVIELVTGGELFDKIASRGRLKEDDMRKHFQQLINAVDYCHSRAVYHRDLKPEKLLLHANGALKVSDFGLDALSKQVRDFSACACRV